MEDKENENYENKSKNEVPINSILNVVGQNEDYLVDQVFNSGYKVF